MNDVRFVTSMIEIFIASVVWLCICLDALPKYSTAIKMPASRFIFYFGRFSTAVVCVLSV